MSRVADPDPHKIGSWIRILIRGNIRTRIRICTEVEIQELLEPQNRVVEAVDAHNGGLEAQMEPWRVFRPVVAYIRITLMRIRIRT